MEKKILKFKNINKSNFSSVLKQRVQQYFIENQISQNANFAMYIKSLFLVILWFSFYFLIVTNYLSYPLTYLVWAMMGFTIALVTMNIGHDSIHGAYTKNPIFNFLLEQTFNLNGASAYMWKSMHNIAHHTYTNIHGYDEDISPIPVIRLSPKAERKTIHQYQYIYAFFFYFLGTFTWVFFKDYVKFFKNEVGNYTSKKHPKSEYFGLFFYKALYYTLFIGIPIYFTEQAWYYTFLGFLIMHLVSGFYLAIVFMMAHAVEEVAFPDVTETGNIETDWFTHQLHTTANFSTGCPVATFLTGGLNQQIEHHLFPNICSIHYPKLSKIVKETANEFDIPYHNSSSFLKALKSHILFLKKMGKE